MAGRRLRLGMAKKRIERRSLSGWKLGMAFSVATGGHQIDVQGDEKTKELKEARASQGKVQAGS
jgi:hypothetical protein